jgi:6-phosphogluconolactonase
MPEIEVLPEARALAEYAARKFITLAAEAISRGGKFAAVLSGGSTPQRMYTLLGKQGYASQIDWPKVHIFWGDERCVPAEHPDSNFAMTRQALLDRVGIPAENIHRIEGELEPALAAIRYEAELKATFGSQSFPRFDLILLGLGEDGHTASLFPGSPALNEHERWVVNVEHITPPPPLVRRITLTLPVLNAAAQVIFLVSGSSKAERLRQVLSDSREPNPLPAQLIIPANGNLLWLVDREAAIQVFPNL